jgi:HK97 gp10 family phage protein
MTKMSMKMEILPKGYDGLRIKFQGILQHLYPDIYEEVLGGATDIRHRIIRSMKETPKTGRVYRRQKGGKKIHIASSPGNPPAVDSSELVSRITMHARRTTIEVGAEAGAPHGKFLEKGTPKMKKRPFLKPAMDRELPGIKHNVKAAIMRLI